MGKSVKMRFMQNTLLKLVSSQTYQFSKTFTCSTALPRPLVSLRAALPLYHFTKRNFHPHFCVIFRIHSPNRTAILTSDSLTKAYRSGSGELTVLSDVSFHIEKGSTAAIIGPSGSGKTTLLGLCAGLDTPSSGSVTINGTTISSLNEDQRAAFRNAHIGFIFQNFQLIPTLTALENVMVPLELRGTKGVRPLAEELLDSVGLAERRHHYPTQLSGGEQQRVAIARAFINKPSILFADEPTGNLDADTGELITRLLFDLNRKQGTTLVLVTHNPELANMTGRVLSLRGGKLVSDSAETPSLLEQTHHS
jgi:putative ABC transport system ATP-binding protein